MKKWCWLLLFVLIYSSFTGCGSKGPNSLTDELKAEVEAAWLKEKGKELTWDDEEFGWTGWIRHYGTYRGAVVLFTSGIAAAETEITVAGETLWWGSACTIRVYKDGEFHSLEEAYELGLLTQENVKRIAEIHAQYVANKDF